MEDQKYKKTIKINSEITEEAIKRNVETFLKRDRIFFVALGIYVTRTRHIFYQYWLYGWTGAGSVIAHISPTPSILTREFIFS